MKDYYDLYLKCGVLLSADVVEKYRNKSIKNYELCQGQCNAMLKMTNIELEFIPDLDMIYLRKIQGVEPLIFLIDMSKPTINI